MARRYARRTPPTPAPKPPDPRQPEIARDLDELASALLERLTGA